MSSTPPASRSSIAAELSRAAIEAAVRTLDRADIASARWFGAKGQSISSVELEHAFVLDPDAGHVLAIASVRLDDGSTQRYTFALTGNPPRVAEPGDGAWRALLEAIVEGRTVPAITAGDSAQDGAARPGPVDAVLVCRPTTALADVVAGDWAGFGEAWAEERPLGRDQSNTSVVVGERLLLKCYRRLETGLNPELELTAFLTEVASFPAVPALAGYVELVSATSGTSTLAIAQEFVANGADAYETLAETLTGWLLAPGDVSVEFATQVAAELGSLTAGLHAALADSRGVAEFEPREATRDELRRWGRDAQRQLVRATDVTPGEAGRVLRELAPAIAAELTTFEAMPSPPLLTRVHGDYHLGQVLIGPDGYRLVDFEGEPLRTLPDRRAHGSPLRDVASMLRSLDHVGRSAGRRAAARHDQPSATEGGDEPAVPHGLELTAWLRRGRERFVDAYVAGLREAGSPIVVDPALLRAFEIEKETYEFIYATTYLPSWLWAPMEGMRDLIEGRA
jgi:maltose alpha-D-glucosyltransferase/alpha-amylase